MLNKIRQYLFSLAVPAILIAMPVIAAAQTDSTGNKPDPDVTDAPAVDGTEATPVNNQSDTPTTDATEAIVPQDAAANTTDAPADATSANSEDSTAEVTVAPADSTADTAVSEDKNAGTSDGQIKDEEAALKHSTAEKKSVSVKPAPAVTTASPENDVNNAKNDAENKRHMFVVTYNMAQPRGKTADFVDKFSFEGFGFEYRFLIKKQLSVGMAFNWNTFEHKSSGTIEIDGNTTITGTRIKMADIIQLTPGVQYHLAKQSSIVVPFVGLNLGPHYTSQIIDWGWWYERVSSWQFGFTPEIGIRVAGLAIPVYVSLRYSYAFEANDIPGQQTFGINLGIAFLK